MRATGLCAIKVEQSPERFLSTLLDLIQTKVNYVVQEAAVVIEDIFRKYPNMYEFLKRPTDTQELVQKVLSLATQDSENPDLRDRGLLS